MSSLLLAWFGPRRSRLEPGGGMPRGLIGAVVRVVEMLSERAPWAVVAVSLALIAWFAVKALDLYVNNDPLSYFPPHHPFVDDAHTVTD